MRAADGMGTGMGWERALVWFGLVWLGGFAFKVGVGSYRCSADAVRRLDVLVRFGFFFLLSSSLSTAATVSG